MLPGYLLALRGLEIDVPIAIFITLTGVKGSEAVYEANELDGEKHEYDRDIIHTSEVLLTEWPVDDTDLWRRLSPAFDEIARGAGLFKSPTWS